LPGTENDRSVNSQRGLIFPIVTHVSVTHTFTLSGVVTEPGGRPVPGARVQLLVSQHAMSDDDGSFRMTGVSAGRAIIEVTKAGYKTMTTDLVVDKDATLNLSPILCHGTTSLCAR
jgi:hypothetical protein